MTAVTPPPEWTGSSSDPNDEQFGDIVRPVDLETLNSVDSDHSIESDQPGDSDQSVDVVIVGEPYDGAVIGRRGAADGPGAIREALAGVKTHHFDAGPVTSVGDVGDVKIPSGSTSEVQAAVSPIAGQVHAADALPVFAGGDNSLSYANARPLLESGSLGVVSFDAHLDCREVDGDPTSGTPYRQLHDDGLNRLAVVGARHFETSTTYADYLDEQGGAIVTAEEVGEDTVEAVDTAVGALGDVDQVYVSVDIDVLDAAHAPGASAPTPGGLTPRELFRALRLVASDDRLAGFEVVECAPRLDMNGRTADAASRAIAHVIAAVQHGGNDA